MVFPAAPRRREAVSPPNREPYTLDTAATALDLVSVARLVMRLQREGIPATLYTTRRGTSYTVVPRRWLDYLAHEESEVWSFCTTGGGYLRDVVREQAERSRWEADEPAPPAPDLPPPPPGGGYEDIRW